MKEHFYIILFFIAALVFLMALPLGVNKTYSGFTVVVDYGNGTKRTFVGSSHNDLNAWDTLQQAVAHSYMIVESTKNFYPKAIDSWEDGSDGKHWVLYVNDRKIDEYPIDVKVNSGDIVVWRFE